MLDLQTIFAFRMEKSLPLAPAPFWIIHPGGSSFLDE